MQPRLKVIVGPFSSEPFARGLRALLTEGGEFDVVPVDDLGAIDVAVEVDRPSLLIIEGVDPAVCRTYLEAPVVRTVVLLDPDGARAFVGVDNPNWRELADVVRVLARELSGDLPAIERDRVRVVDPSRLLPSIFHGSDSTALAPLAEWVELTLALGLTRRSGPDQPGVPGWSIAPREAFELLGMDPSSANGQALSDRLAAADHHLVVTRTSLPGALADVAQAFLVSDLDLRLLCLALAPELDGRYATVIGVLQDDLTRRRPGVTLFAELMSDATLTPWDLRRTLHASESVIAKGLVRAAEIDALAVDVGYLPSAAVVAHLLTSSADGAAAHVGAQLRSLSPGSEPPLSTEESGFARRLEVAAAHGDLVHVVGGDPSKRWFSRLTARIGWPLLVGNLALTDTGAARTKAVCDWVVLSRLQGSALLLLGTDVLGEADRLRVAELVLRRARSGGLVASDGPLAAGTPVRERLTMRAPVVSATHRSQWWARAAEQGALPLGPGDVERLAATVALEPDTFDDAATMAAQHLAAGTPGTAVELVQRAARDLRPTDLPAGVRSVEPVYGWDDIVLGQENRTLLGAIPQHVLHAGRVLEEWGFAARVPYGQGVAALFSGPSGTGKTMAAQIIARDLGVDLLQVDLSKTVSKYIGETEKNLDRVFDAAEHTGAVLLFDEADAVFGRRTEIKDAHDRHANVEVAYLLQRLEAFRGLTILTTNLKANIDGAFLRRLRFVVDFAVPTAAERTRIWHKAFPLAAPLAGLDVAAVASRLPITGGSIQSIALHAAFLAAPGGGPIGLDHVRTATRRELRKTGLLAAEKTLDDWPVPEPAASRRW